MLHASMKDRIDIKIENIDIVPQVKWRFDKLTQVHIVKIKFMLILPQHRPMPYIHNLLKSE